MVSSILVDQDNTLTDFIEVTVRYLSKLYGQKTTFTPEECKNYNVLKNMFPDLPDTTISNMFEELFSASGFWSSMKPLPNSIEVMEELYKKYELFIVTSPWKTSKNCIPEKIEWVERYLPFFDISRLIFCSHKHLLSADVMIDDSPVYLGSSNCKYKIAFDYPYNELVSSDYRVKNWLTIREILLEESVLKTKLKTR